MCSVAHFEIIKKKRKPRGKFEIKEIAIYIGNKTKYFKIILYCIKHEIFFNNS